LTALSSIGQTNFPRLENFNGDTLVLVTPKQFQYFHYIDLERKSLLTRELLLLEQIKNQELIICKDSIDINRLEQVIKIKEEEYILCNNDRLNHIKNVDSLVKTNSILRKVLYGTLVAIAVEGIIILIK